MSIKDELLFLFGGYALAAVVAFAASVLRKRVQNQGNNGKNLPPEPTPRWVGIKRFTIKGFWVSSQIIAVCVTLFVLTPLAFSGGALGGLFLLVLLFVALPFALIYITRALGQLRQIRGGNIRRAPLWPSMLTGIGGLAFLLPGSSFLINSLLYFTGLVHQVQLRVSAVADRTMLFDQGMSTVSGDYLLNGEWTHLKSSWWMDLFHDLPSPGHNIQVAITPLWPYPMIESLWSAGFVFTLALMPVALGSVLIYLGTRDFRASHAASRSRDSV